MKKGIILGNALLPVGGETLTIQSPQSSEIRKYLLYWDEIDIPTYDNGSFQMKSGIIDELNSLSCITNTPVNVPNIGMFTAFQKIGQSEVHAQVEAYRIRSQEAETFWSIAQNSLLPTGLDSDIKENSIELELYNCLPVPAENIAYNDILEFKASRQDELSELQIYLEEITQKIASAEDFNRSLKLEVANLKRAVSAIEQLLQENTIAFNWRSIKKIIRAANAAGIGAAGLGVSLGLPIEKTLLMAGASSCISLALKESVSIGSSQSLLPETYLASISREGLDKA